MKENLDESDHIHIYIYTCRVEPFNVPSAVQDKLQEIT